MVKPQTERWTDRLFSFLAVRLFVWLSAVVYLAPGWLTAPWSLMEYMDDHHHHALDAIGRITYLRYHQFPLWNPYMCGGTVGIAEPESIYLAPDFLIRSLFWGPERGRHVLLVVMTVIGMEGMYRLARKFEASAIGASFGAVIYATQYILLAFAHDGAQNFITGFELIPWAILCFHEGLDSFPWRLFGGFVAAWIFLCAGTYPTPYMVWVLTVAALSTTATLAFDGRRRAWIKPWTTLATMAGVAFLLSVAKLLPLLSFLGQNKRVWTVVETHPAAALLQEVTGHYPWLFVFAFVGVLFFDRVAAFFVGVAGLFFFTAMGDFDPLSPYHLIKQVPFLGQLRNPERYMLLVVLYLSLASARGLTRLEDAVPAIIRRLFGRAPTPRFVNVAVVGLAALTVATQVYPRVKTTLTEHIVTTDLFSFEPPRKTIEPFRQVRGNRRDPHVFVDVNVGTLLCIAGIGIPQSPDLRADLPAEEYPLDPTKATVRRVRWTPNQIDLAISASAPTRVIINQNWNKHFKSSVGQVVNDRGLLAIDVPPGTYELRVAYRDRVFDVCIVVSALSLLALIVYAYWYWWRRIEFAVRRFRSLPTFPPEGPNVV